MEDYEVKKKQEKWKQILQIFTFTLHWDTLLYLYFKTVKNTYNIFAWWSAERTHFNVFKVFNVLTAIRSSLSNL